MSKFDDYYTFVGQDFSQMEIRVMAHMANDKAYIKVFESGKDPHAMVGSELTGQSFEEIVNNEDIRAAIKALHFAMVYGKKPPNIRLQIIADTGKDISLSKVEKYYNAYFKKYEGVKLLIDDLIEFAEKHGYTENIFGFRRPIEGSSGFWENVAINTPVQGGAHQILLIGIALLYLKPKKYWTFAQLLMEVHDALYSRVKLKNLKEHYKQGQELLQEEIPRYIQKWFGFKMRVPLVADCKVGFRMGVMSKYKGEPIDEFLDKWREENKKVEARVNAELKKYSSN